MLQISLAFYMHKDIFPKCLSVDEWISKIWYICTMKYSTLKRKDILSHATIWMKLENIMLNEINQIQKDKHYVFPLIGGS